VVINDFNIEGIALVPQKTDSPLIINSYAVLTNAFSAKRLQPIGGWHAQVIQGSGIADHPQFPPSNLLDILRQSL
jgi:hypothetical protein